MSPSTRLRYRKVLAASPMAHYSKSCRESLSQARADKHSKRKEHPYHTMRWTRHGAAVGELHWRHLHHGSDFHDDENNDPISQVGTFGWTPHVFFSNAPFLIFFSHFFCNQRKWCGNCYCNGFRWRQRQIDPSVFFFFFYFYSFPFLSTKK